jgi:hypothetical protein
MAPLGAKHFLNLMTLPEGVEHRLMIFWCDSFPLLLTSAFMFVASNFN